MMLIALGQEAWWGVGERGDKLLILNTSVHKSKVHESMVTAKCVNAMILEKELKDFNNSFWDCGEPS